VLTAALGIAVLLLVLGIGGSLLAAAVFPRAPGWLPSMLLVLTLAVAVLCCRAIAQLRAELRARHVREAEARREADTDPLTGCANRRSIGPASTRLIAAASTRDESIAVLMIDLDNFKYVNDTYGHRVGDVLLAECAGRIRALLPPGAVLARLGGDEFACVIAYPPAHPHQIDRLASTIIQQGASAMEIGGFQLGFTLSVGVSAREAQHLPSEGPSGISGLLHQADIALYQAKKQGRNRYLWFADTMEEALRHRCELETGIREGLARGEFVPYYQPLVDLNSGTLMGFEMLARWQSPRFGLLEPAVFIPIAEEIGCISELSEVLFREGLREARGWRPGLILALNISSVQVRDPWFAQKLLRLIHAENFPRERLEIEISETCLHGDIAGVTTLLASLKNMGIRLCLDDFGTGFSSLTQLRSLPFDQIKLHRGLIAGITEDADSRAIVESVITLGRGLGLPILMEGIDSQHLLEAVRQLGDFRGQGYIFGEPQPAEETRALMSRYLGPEPGASIAAPPQLDAPTEAEPAVKSPTSHQRRA
jgi:diguanylate cyclase (GGDEF)-like protein